MKYKFLISLLLIIPLSTTCSEPEKVYICRSASSYAYHTKVCRGLKNCRHRVDLVIVSVAIKEGYNPCGNCYKKKKSLGLLPKEEKTVRKIQRD